MLMASYLDQKEAAAYVGLTVNQFRYRIRIGAGPRYIHTSPHKRLFTVADLDEWMKSWAETPPLKTAEG